jgi:transposase
VENYLATSGDSYWPLTRQEAQPAAVIATAWKAQQRLHRTWRRLDTDRGKRRTIVAVAVARHLVGFVWAIATID